MERLTIALSGNMERAVGRVSTFSPPRHHLSTIWLIEQPRTYGALPRKARSHVRCCWPLTCSVLGRWPTTHVVLRAA